ncbi:sugar phosphate isomerase/epimerase family protein [Solirubrobacter soli]|uniref:sugar phosphate isomerase/epimerase family protein n=1 Tax=Solirubrobacter soli TaxID=363832 RepID=UPI00041E7C9F|nr:sugar phosphate isomerase/epimerase [Solirubrobacter soli]
MKLAVQLYTLRAKLAEDVPGTLQALAAAGAEEVELAGLYERSAGELRAILDDVGLRAASMHAPLQRLETEPEAVIDEAQTLGVDTVIMPWLPEPPENASDADEIVARIVAAGQKIKDAGLRYGYHNHAFEFGPADLWGKLVASGIDLEPDVGWIRIAGRDPITELNDLSGRILLVHAKDVRPDGDGWIDVVAGDGELDFKAIADAARQGGASHLVVELDTPSDDPVEDARRSLNTLREAIA